MVVHFFGIIAFVFLYSASVQSHAQTAEKQSIGPVRLVSVTINGHTTELLVRFDRPISHYLSSLSIVRDGRMVATPRPRLEAAPNVLFARIPTPAAGSYIVRWTACPEGTADRYDGEFSFTVGNGALRPSARRSSKAFHRNMEELREYSYL